LAIAMSFGQHGKCKIGKHGMSSILIIDMLDCPVDCLLIVFCSGNLALLLYAQPLGSTWRDTMSRSLDGPVCF